MVGMIQGVEEIEDFIDLEAFPNPAEDIMFSLTNSLTNSMVWRTSGPLMRLKR
tara:strand:+ start:450 stop:608 length:159 start_codon:yes stop_codon:yes gene_type:complete